MQNDTDEAERITAAIEDGSYYEAGRNWYSSLFHTPIAERSYYLVVIFLAIINGYFAITSFLSIFPIRPQVPFVTYSDNVDDDLPRIIRINASQKEDKNIAVMKFMLRNYVINREAYDLSRFELRYRNIWSQSSGSVFDAYKAVMDASNPYSPYRLYTNKARRDINITALSFERGPEVSRASVVFEASVVSLTDSEEINHSRWRADITYKYTDFMVDQSLSKSNFVAQLLGLTGNTVRASGEKRKVVPMTFVVSGYQVKELLE